MGPFDASTLGGLQRLVFEIDEPEENGITSTDEVMARYKAIENTRGSYDIFYYIDRHINIEKYSDALNLLIRLLADSLDLPLIRVRDMTLVEALGALPGQSCCPCRMSPAGHEDRPGMRITH